MPARPSHPEAAPHRATGFSSAAEPRKLSRWVLQVCGQHWADDWAAERTDSLCVRRHGSLHFSGILLKCLHAQHSAAEPWGLSSLQVRGQ